MYFGENMKNNDYGVSPVVGVMMMLVVTIIIAAVVSGFSGGLVDMTQKAPSATVEVHVKNGGDNETSYFSMKVMGVSEPIHTKNLKLVTSWVAKDESGNTVSGGNTCLAGKAGATKGDDRLDTFSAPTGYGAGVNAWADSNNHPAGAQWGNFTWLPGTTMMDTPSGDYSGYTYSDGGTDAMQAILGESWYLLRPGDTVNVRVFYASSGKAIVDRKVSVEG